MFGTCALADALLWCVWSCVLTLWRPVLSFSLSSFICPLAVSFECRTTIFHTLIPCWGFVIDSESDKPVRISTVPRWKGVRIVLEVRTHDRVDGQVKSAQVFDQRWMLIMVRCKTSSMQNYPTSSRTSSVPDFDHLISRPSTIKRRGKTKRISRSSSYIVPETPPAINTTGIAPEEALSVRDWQIEEDSKYLPSPPQHPARGMDRIPFAREVKTIASIEDVPASQRPPRRSTTASSQSDNFSEYLPTPASSVRSQDSRSFKATRNGFKTSLIDGSNSQNIPSTYTAITETASTPQITELPRYLLGLPRRHPDLEHFKIQLRRQFMRTKLESADLLDGHHWAISKDLRDRLGEIYRIVSSTLEIYKDLLRNDLLRGDNKTFRLVKSFRSACDDQLAKLRSPKRELYTPTISTGISELIKNSVSLVNGKCKRNSYYFGQSSQHVFRF